MSKRKKSVPAEAANTDTTTGKQRTTAAKPKTKLGQLEAMLRRPDGATIEQISKSLAWQAHSVRGAMSGHSRRSRA